MAKKEVNAALKANASKVIIKPRITEKAAKVSQNNVYTFLVDPRSNKTQIAEAFFALFGKKPLSVRVVNISSRGIMKRGLKAKQSGHKKAYVYLKKGETVDFM